MLYFVDINTFKFVPAPGVRGDVSAIEFKRGDHHRVSVAFLDGFNRYTFPTGAMGHFGLTQVS